METCISIGPAAQVLLNQGLAKQITKKEAITKIKDFQKKGAVHQATLTVPLKDFQGKYQFDRLCNCCWDCCTLLGSYNRGQLPYMLQAFHKAIVANPDACTGCEICIPICPTLAISLNDSKIPEIYEKICIGCGLCDTLCPEEVFEMIEEERKVFLPMHEKSEARIKPKVSKVEKDDDFAIDVTAISDKAEVLKELENYRQLFLLEKNKKAFSNYSKTLQWHFTDIDVFYHFVVKDGVPSELKEGKIENPDIFYTLSGTVFVGMRQGIIDPMKAYRKKLTKADAAIKDLMKLSKLEEK
jgi:Pyruvate/2-oxoacid:ferredoxin oxidoreductase delta subunit